MIVIEHNIDVIKTADWIIDLGPEGGERGGLVVAEGTPEEVSMVDQSYTGQFLKQILGMKTLRSDLTGRNRDGERTCRTYHRKKWSRHRKVISTGCLKSQAFTF